jgi:hypothetical protein
MEPVGAGVFGRTSAAAWEAALAIAGGTLTGPLNGTSFNFSGNGVLGGNLTLPGTVSPGAISPYSGVNGNLTLQGNILLDRNPTAPLQAVPLQYLNSALAALPPGTSIGTTPPVAPKPGQLWWDPDSAQLYVWTSAEWVIATNQPGGGSGGGGGGGGMVLLQTQDVSTAGAAQVIFLMDGTYSVYLFVFDGVIANQDASLTARFSRDGGATFMSANSTYEGAINRSASPGGSWSGNTGNNGMTLASLLSGTAAGGLSGMLKVFNPAAARPVRSFLEFAYYTGATTPYFYYAVGGYQTVAAQPGPFNAIGFILLNGAFASGTIKMLGMVP